MQTGPGTSSIRKPRRVYPVPECAQAAAKWEVMAALDVAQGVVKGAHSQSTFDINTARLLVKRWGTWNESVRNARLVATKHARQSMARSYRQRLHRLS
ncbi:unnamed protein product [Peronospora belbahrii]|uniref:Uncharacterized protein n=1 Tax=Peronospora belbahrii TaxID=622444 RepID=A0ABN8CJJ7_9STRA|nr:unnamed protein product [Peronospora belbahrii]